MSQSSGPGLQGTPLPPSQTGGIGGAIQGLMSGGGPNIQGPPLKQYGQAIGQAGTNAQNLLGLGAGYSQQAAQIQNPWQTQSQQQLQATEQGLGQLAGAYNAYGDSRAAAQAQFQQSQGQSIAAALAQQANARGPGTAGAMLAANAGQFGAANQAAGASGATQAQQQQFGMQGQAGAYGQVGGMQLNEYQLEQQSAAAQAQLQLQNQAQQNAMQLGLYGLGEQAQGQQLSGLNAYTQGLLGAQGLQQQGFAQTNALGNQFVGGAAGGLQAGLQYGAMQGGGNGGGWQQGSGGVGTSSGIGPGY